MSLRASLMQDLRLGKENLMSRQTSTVEASEVRTRVRQGDAMLVCAYDDPEKFREYAIDDALSRQEFDQRLSQIPLDREVVFYCA